MRGVALAVCPLTVAAHAASSLMAPAGMRPRTPSQPVARVSRALPATLDRVRTVAGAGVVNGVTLALPVLPGVQPGGIAATVEEVASAAGLDVGTVRWANDLRESQEAAPGQVLVIPPGPGSLMWRAAGETPEGFAQRTGVPVATLAAFNSHPESGSRRYLQVPFGTLGAALAASEVVVAAPGVPAVPSSQRNRGGNHFPYGQCTWFVASKRDVRWNGDAGQWLREARGLRPEGKVPVIGAIAVQPAGAGVSSVGHVTYVQSLNDDGSFQVAEMNYRGWAVVDQRTMRVGRDAISGFIY